MSPLPVLDPQRLGFDANRLERAFQLLNVWTRDHTIPGAAMCVGTKQGIVGPGVFGRMGPDGDAPAIGPDALFLLASITKPVTVAAVMLLIERSEVALDDRVPEFVPSFAQNGKNDVRIRQLMTHTSGLPDMVPDNRNLRASHAPLERFIESITRVTLAFAPGTQVSYQSTGMAMLAEVVHHVAGVTC